MRWLLTLLLCVLPAAAQNPRGLFNWWDSPIARDLNLTDSQREQIRSTVRDYRGKLVDQRAAVEKAELEVEDVFNSDALDQQRATAAIDRLANARGDMIRVFSQMSLQMRTVLTPEQWRQLQSRRPRMGPSDRMGPGGPAGPMGPRRGPMRRGQGPGPGLD
ncbi:MAG: Spy/CpxP family protein refolding chaperone [Bryobacteraceae bacterium]|nr:Spy/CpxP family protein refolding chaperone [Bryobacteraceae bacterium]